MLFLFLFANVNAKTVTDLTGKKVTIKDNPSRIAIVPIPWASLAYAVDGDSSKIVGMHPSAKKSYEKISNRDERAKRRLGEIFLVEKSI